MRLCLQRRKLLRRIWDFEVKSVTKLHADRRAFVSCCAVKLYMLKKSRIGSNPFPLPTPYSLLPIFIIRFSRLTA